MQRARSLSVRLWWWKSSLGPCCFVSEDVRCGIGRSELTDVSFHQTIPRPRCWSREKQSLIRCRGDFLKCKQDSAISMFKTICFHWSQNQYIYQPVLSMTVKILWGQRTRPSAWIHQCLLQCLANNRFLVNKVSHTSGTVTVLRAHPNCKLICQPATIS